MRRISRIAAIAGAIAASAFAACSARAECGYEKLVVEGDGVDRAATCEAVRDVAAFFSGIGLAFDPDLTLRYLEKVFLEFHEPGESRPAARLQVSGYYDSHRKLIETTSPVSAFRAGRKPWRLEWNAELAYSIVRHELIHAGIYQALGQRANRVSKSWSEFVAYAGQFEMMPENLRRRILAAYPEAKAFDTVAQVNSFIYGYDPDLFGVRAHLFVRAKGGSAFLRSLLDGTANIELGEIFWMR